MTGYKTKIGALSLLIPGILALLDVLLDVNAGVAFNQENLTAAMAMLGSGLSVLGIGHKVEKAGNQIANAARIAASAAATVATTAAAKS